jgi:hypothetical protein
MPSDVEGVNLLDSERLKLRTLQSSCLSREGVCLSLISDRYKLIVNRDAGLAQRFPYEALLFDLQQDPQENQDVTGTVAVLRENLQQELVDWVLRIAVHPEDEFVITPQSLANLKALGYVQ